MPANTIERPTVIATGPGPATAEPAGTAAQETGTQTVMNLERVAKTIDWDKAREFQLSARLSVNTQLNRPKFIRPEPRKVKPTRAAEMRWKITGKTASPVTQAGLQSAVVIAFPMKGGDGKLARAA